MNFSISMQVVYFATKDKNKGQQKKRRRKVSQNIYIYFLNRRYKIEEVKKKKLEKKIGFSKIYLFIFICIVSNIT